eukprot:TRINITY_DN88486_c0_g1_i1.p1 TRINITY_DN88486_c0_g1~~TRINITY_DN88486_c0_g1_i1.p1  ORF type:complete len:963 (-),score=105.90 TRINITY_DN88486_c0_g1_i1:195-2678(-)
MRAPAKIGMWENGTEENSSDPWIWMNRYSRARAHGVLSTVPSLRYAPAPISQASNASLAAEMAGANAVVYVLLVNPPFDAVLRLLKSFSRNFLRRFPYPMILCVEADAVADINITSAAVLQAAEALHEDIATEDRLEFPAHVLLYGSGDQPMNGQELGVTLPFPLRIWRIPKLLTAPAWIQRRPKFAPGCSQERPEIHRAHMRRLPDLLAHELSYNWLWRVSQSSELVEPVLEDPFRILEARNARIGHIGYMPYKEACMGGMIWDMALEEARRVTGGTGEALPTFRGLAGGEYLGQQLEQWPRGKVFVTDSLISHSSVWAAPAARRLLGRVDRSGGLWDLGWDEALIVTLVALAAAEGPYELHQIHTLPFRNLPYVQWRRPKPASFWALPGQSRMKRKVRIHQLNPSGLASTPAFQAWFPNSIHPQTNGWIGGDIGASVLLPPVGLAGPTRLWLFGDSLIGTATPAGVNQNRSGIRKMVPHSFARSRQVSTGVATVRTIFEWGDPSIFDCSDVEEPQNLGIQAGEECVLWPAAAIAVEMPPGQGARLAIVAQRVARFSHAASVNTLDFRRLGSVLIIVRNPHEHSTLWSWQATVLDESNWWTNGISSASGSPWAKETDTLYIMGRHHGQETEGASLVGWGDSGLAFVARIRAGDLVALRHRSLEVLVQPSASVHPAIRPIWTSAAAVLGSEYTNHSYGYRLFTLFSPAPSESSLLFYPSIGLWIFPSVENLRPLSVLTLRLARQPEGPWSIARPVVSLPNEFMGHVCYAPKAHSTEVEELVVLSVVCVQPESNLHDLGVSKATTYTPLFFPVQLTLPENRSAMKSFI